MKMRRLFIAFTCLMFVTCLASCKREYTDNCIIVGIKSEYKERFENKEFTISDFQYDNIESFRYSFWYEDESNGIMFVYLKKHGSKQIKKALEHIEKLDFVEWVEVNSIGYLIE